MGQALAVAGFGLVAIWFAVVVFRTASMMRSALALLAVMVALGGIFLTLEAEFLGVLQLMMMASEMAIMGIFMVMYMMDPGGVGQMEMAHQKWTARAVAVLGALGAIAVAALTNWPGQAGSPAPAEQLRLLGLEIMGRSMLIFETAGVTILVAMIAATALAIASRR